jgi:hypothetical protein
VNCDQVETGPKGVRDLRDQFGLALQPELRFDERRCCPVLGTWALNIHDGDPLAQAFGSGTHNFDLARVYDDKEGNIVEAQTGLDFHRMHTIEGRFGMVDDSGVKAATCPTRTSC